MPPVHRRGRVVEIESLERFDALLAGGACRMRGWRLQSIDLRRRTEALLALDPAGALLLGCRVEEPAATALRAGGAVLFPAVPDVPVDSYRPDLYTAAELYAGLGDAGGYESTLDARVYAWSQRPLGDAGETVVRALHDAAIEDALDDALDGRQLVAVMGGHGLARDDPAYAAAATLGRGLVRSGLTVGTGGGPGAMEAVNLGSYLAVAADDALPAALEMVAAVPSFRPSVATWAAAAFDVVACWPGGDGGIGVPTWFYGHEPPNVFASAIAKYFQNSVREATLLQRAGAGVAFLPGAAGTVQEVFQDACENFYADAPTVAPMVLVGVEHWTTRLPAWPLLQALATGRPMESLVTLVDTVAEALDILTNPGARTPRPVPPAASHG
ncbi:MAG: Rossmann fold nucleotide-binding protein [Actinomycetota bacterium]|nr:Rossmann fold nucleotide-binding protein [Actinomycetota bacterium]